MSTAASNKSLPMIELKGERARELGALTVIKDSKRSTLPLASVDIKARVADRVAEVIVKETFQNPYTEHLEAVYIFPLAGGCAVSNFEMKVGERIITGIVEERGQARQNYQKAVDEGKRAALLEQERDDVFTVQVGNLPPGEEITVIITYSERLPYFDNGTTEMRLPLVVAPRYIPGNPVMDRPSVGEGVEFDSNIVPDASRITPPRLVEGFDPKVALSINVELSLDETGNNTELEDLSCSQHATRTSLGRDTIKVSLSRDDEPLNRDFVLRWHLAAKKMRSTFLFYRDPKSNKKFGMISLVPPTKDLMPVTARDVIFVVDRSGSMGGIKMSSAARACSLLLATLGPQDRFAIQVFDNVAEWMQVSGSDKPFMNADERGIECGNKFLREVTARGGTELNMAMQQALAMMAGRTASAGRMPVIVLLTDGQVGDESRVLREIQTHLADNRVFTVGIDTAVNEGFLKRLATLGGGTSTFVAPGAQLESALSHVGREIGAPLVTDLSISDVSAVLDSTSVAPSHIPDLFVGRATTAFFSFTAPDKEARVRLRGKYADGRAFDEELKGKPIELSALGQLWAKAHVADLEDRFRIEPHNQATLKQTIVDVAVAHSLLTKFTAFVVVDESEIVNTDGVRRKIVQPVEQPAQWVELEKKQIVLGGSGTAWGAPIQAKSCWDAQAGGQMQQQQMQPMEMASWSAPAPEPTPPPAPAAPPPSLAESVKRKENLPAKPSSSLMGQLVRQRSAGDGPPSQAMSARKDSRLPSNELVLHFQSFEAALLAVWTELKAGRIVAPEFFEAARLALLNALAQSDAADRLPLLQRFLRSEALALGQVLVTNGSGIQSLTDFCNHQEDLFKKVKQEFGLLGSSSATGGGNFWESSI